METIKRDLPDRLYLIAKEIPEGDAVADIGTDHAIIPVYLAKENIARKIIMTDISKASLEKAVTNVREELQDAGKIEPRQGDGLIPLERGECDDIVIAGIGGLLMTEIMEWDLPKTRTYRKFVLQPRKNVWELRRWLLTNGFRITKNILVREGSHISEIITAEPDDGGTDDLLKMRNYEGPEAEAELTYPSDLVSPLEEGLRDEYLSEELEKAKKIREKILGAAGEDSPGVLRFDERIRRLSGLCEEKNL